MSLIAVDIALLPSNQIMRNLMGLIEYDASSPIRLNTEDCLPHISLAMGVLDESNLKKVEAVLSSLASGDRLFELTVETTRTDKIANGVNISSAVVEYDSRLTSFHVEVMKQLRPLLIHNDVQPEMFFSPPRVAEISTTWVKHYFEKQKPEDFHPHITLGEGSVRQTEETISFIPERLALCHLGTYCTCRKILTEINLLSKKA